MRCEASSMTVLQSFNGGFAQLMRIRRKECGVEERDEHIHEELSQLGGVHTRDEPFDVMSCSPAISRNRVV